MSKKGQSVASRAPRSSASTYAVLAGFAVAAVLLSACSDQAASRPAFVSNTPVDESVVVGYVDQPADAFVAASAVVTLQQNIGASELSGNSDAATLAEPFESYDELVAAVRAGDVDVAIAPVGTLLESLSAGGEFAPADATIAAERVRAFVDGEGLELLEPSPATGGASVVVTSDFAKANDVVNLAALAEITDELLVSGPPECFDGLDSWLCGSPLVLPGGYAAEFSDTIVDEATDPLAVLRDGEVDVVVVPNVAAGIDEPTFTILKDNLSYFPAQNYVALLRDGMVRNERRDLLVTLMASLTDDLVRSGATSIGLDAKTPLEAAK